MSSHEVRHYLGAAIQVANPDEYIAICEARLVPLLAALGPEYCVEHRAYRATGKHYGPADDVPRIDIQHIISLPPGQLPVVLLDRLSAGLGWPWPFELAGARALRVELLTNTPDVPDQRRSPTAARLQHVLEYIDVLQYERWRQRVMTLIAPAISLTMQRGELHRFQAWDQLAIIHQEALLPPRAWNALHIVSGRADLEWVDLCAPIERALCEIHASRSEPRHEVSSERRILLMPQAVEIGSLTLQWD